MLDGPVGQLSLIGLVLDEHDMLLDYELSVLTDVPRFRKLLATRASTRLPEIRELAHTDSRRLMDVVARFVESTHHGFAPFGHRRFVALRSCADVLHPVAEALTAAPEFSWWWDTVGANQFITQTATGTRIDVENLTDDEALDWWVVPRASRTLHTTRGPVAGAGSVGAICAEDIATEDPEVAHFTPPAGDVLELSTPREWAQLVVKYPRKMRDPSNEWRCMTGCNGPWLVPDWSQVAQHCAGVHLPLATYLAAAYRPIPVDGGYTILAGWDPDATVWLDVDAARIVSSRGVT